MRDGRDGAWGGDARRACEDAAARSASVLVPPDELDHPGEARQKAAPRMNKSMSIPPTHSGAALSLLSGDGKQRLRARLRYGGAISPYPPCLPHLTCSPKLNCERM
eukprot:365390-Chlamydomonas_euryale.AAC.5